jgi:hypothetical protein
VGILLFSWEGAITLIVRASLKRVDHPRERISSHIFPRSAEAGTPGPQHSKRPITPSKLSAYGDSSDSEDAEATPNRRPSFHRKKSDASTKAPSRPASRSSRKRSDSSATTPGDKETTGTKLAGWASAVTGRGKKKEKFAALKDGDSSDDGGGPLRRSLSSQSTSSKTKSKEGLAASPKVPTRILKPPALRDRKVVRAIDDFNGSVDELDFKAGDEILVVNEVLDGWWMGELDGKKGLFPTSHTEVIPVASSRLLHQQQRSSLSLDGDGYVTSDFEDVHLKPVQHAPTDVNVFYGHVDDASIMSSGAEEESSPGFMPSTWPASPHPPPIPRRVTTDTEFNSSSPGKRGPPPPPPRRSGNSYLSATPPIPPRRQSPSSLSTSTLANTGDISPFESTSDLEQHSAPQDVNSKDLDSLSIPTSSGEGASPFESAIDLTEVNCNQFEQNPFKPPGMCSNCFHLHT